MMEFYRKIGWLGGRALLLVGAIGASAAALWAQDLTGFQPNREYMVEVDGETLSKADVYWSQSARAFLLVAKDLGQPLLVQPARQSVSSVPSMKLAARNGTVDILAGASLTPVARLEVSGEGASFELDGRRVRMAEKPPLVGWQSAASITEYNATYAERAAAYTPDPATIADLRARTSEVKLTVFFGSWCPFCQQKVPMAMKVADALSGSKIQINFYGFPRSFGGDNQARRYKIKSVPTGIVFVGDREVGRITGDGWSQPEATLLSLIPR